MEDSLKIEEIICKNTDENDGLDDIESLVEDDDVTEYIGSFDELIESDRIDMSIDPTVCLFPHQMKFLQNEKGTLSDTIDPFYKRVQPQFAYDGLGDPKNKNKNAKYDEYIELCNYDIEKEKPGIYDRQIGHIFLNVESNPWFLIKFHFLSNSFLHNANVLE